MNALRLYILSFMQIAVRLKRMTRPNIIFTDVNTIWHRQIAMALAEETATVAIAPTVDPFLRRRSRTELGGLATRNVGIPPGWASRTAMIGQRLIAQEMLANAKTLSAPIAVLTSPAYAPLSRHLVKKVPIVTYTADDYGSYEGWSNARIQEREMQSRALLCVFVSEALRRRAVEVDGVSEDRTFVSPNATEKRFGIMGRGPLPASLEGRARPILGVLGDLSERLDLRLISEAVSLSSVGTFLVAGSVSQNILRRYPVLASDKVFVTGPVPHSEMDRYAKVMDAALIPYADNDLNRFCSPLRLYDHLASGAYILALPTCDQVRTTEVAGLTVGPAEFLLDRLRAGIPTRRLDRRGLSLYWNHRAANLLAAIEAARNRAGIG